MDWQLFVTILLIVLAVIVVSRNTWRAWFGSSSGGCGHGCSSCVANPPTQSEVASGRISLPRA